MTQSLTDELEATLRKLDQLHEVWMQAQAYQGALTRLHYLAPLFEALQDDAKQVRQSMSPTAWLALRLALLRVWPAEMENLGQALITGDESFLRLVGYLGYVRGVLAVFGQVPPHNLSKDAEYQ